MAGFSLIGVHHRQGEQAKLPEESFFLYSGESHEQINKYNHGGSHRLELWHHQPQQIHPYELFAQPRSSMRRALADACGGGGSFSCQDCGNQAKKDCTHLRCRTCCKSRGLHCLTHVKSTWIPVAKRRERQEQRVASAAATASVSASASMSTQREGGCGGGSRRAQGLGGGIGETSKRPRDITAYTRIPTTATATAITYGGASEVGRLYPPELSGEAVFRCVRVSAAEEIDGEYAYQTAVSIGGHVFKGLLYDQGPDQSESSTAVRQTLPALNYRLSTQSGSSQAMTTAAAATATVAATAAAASAATAAFLEPYPTPFGSTFMASTPFFLHHPRP